MSGSNTLIPIGVLYSLLSFEAQNIFFACFIFSSFPRKVRPGNVKFAKNAFPEHAANPMQKMQMRSANPLQTSDFSEMQMGHENLSQKNAKTIHFQHPSLYQTISHKWPIYFLIYVPFYVFRIFSLSSIFKVIMAIIGPFMTSLRWCHLLHSLRARPSDAEVVTTSRRRTKVFDILRRPVAQLRDQYRGFLAVCYGKYPLIYDLPIKQKWSSIAMLT